MGALQGKPGGGLLSPRILIEMKKALYTGHLSLWELCKGNLEVGSSHRWFWETDEGGSVNRASLSIGALQGEPEGGFLSPRILRDRWRRLCKQGISLYGSSARGTWRESSFTGDPEGYVKEGSGKRHLSPLGPRLVTWKGAHLSRTLRDGRRRSLKTDRLYVYFFYGPMKLIYACTVQPCNVLKVKEFLGLYCLCTTSQSKIFEIFLKSTKQAMYVQHNIEARSCNHCFLAKAVINIYSECVFASLVIQHEERTRRVVLPTVTCLYHISPPLVLSGSIFSGWDVGEYVERKLCALGKHVTCKKTSAICYHKCTQVFMYSTCYSF